MTMVSNNKQPVFCVSFIITYISINIFTNVLYPWQQQEISINYLHTKYDRMVFNKVSDSLAHYKNNWL